ncbi:hypothetical protein C2845_PM09G07480 [Panicum miliaceum]|uniref:Uncharacterized protein n=1 Tax=Panicum miliaceum TaxID=4540 RepID=A0A3L6RYI4_PANMI|nr:hypothetical protein C2845_PM09G07480 [Panicum miliaceum]
MYILGGLDFDIVNLFICELEDAIMDGMTIHRQQPFAHWISWICAQLAQGHYMEDYTRSRTRFKVYSPSGPRDGHRGARGQQILQQRAEAEGAADPTAAEAASLAAAEARLPTYLATDSEDSEDDEDYIPSVAVHREAHDSEAGPSGAGAAADTEGAVHHELSPPTPPPVIAAQVTVLDTLATILQALTEEQRRSNERQDRLQAEQARL